MERSYRTFTAMLECRHCGGGLPLQGPLRTVRCAACQGDNQLAADTVADYLYRAANRTQAIMGEVKFGYPDGHPCASCGAVVDLIAGSACAKCGTEVVAVAPPVWLKTRLPALAQLIGTEQDPADAPAAAAAQAVVAKGAAPVVFACPSCQGALKITGDTARTATCEFCSASVYLPDDLWRTLHPVKRVAPWTIAWDGEHLQRLEDIRSREQALHAPLEGPGSVPPSTWLPGRRMNDPAVARPRADAGFRPPSTGFATILMIAVAALGLAMVAWLVLR